MDSNYGPFSKYQGEGCHGFQVWVNLKILKRKRKMNWHLEHQVFFTHEGERDSALSGVTLLRIQLLVTLMKITMIILAMVTGNSAG